MGRKVAARRPHRRVARERREVRFTTFCGYDDPCGTCDLTYREFRTGLTYSDVWAMRWKNTDDRSQWKYKRRGSVLGMWHQTKKGMWEDHKEACLKAALDGVPF